MGNKNNKPSSIREDELPKRNKKQSQTISTMENSMESTNKLSSKKYDELSLLSVSAAARLLRVGISRIYQLIENGKLKTADFDGRIRIPYFELKNCLESISNYHPVINKSLTNNSLKSCINATPKDIMDRIKKLRT